MMLLQTLSFSTLSILFVLIFIGGYVSASGVGLSCPDWPLCPAGLIPLQEFIIEYFHRTIAAITGLMVIITMIFTLKSKQAPQGMKIASLIAASAVIAQITLGAIVIIERLHAHLVTLHLGIGIILFSMMVLVTLYSRRTQNNNTKESISNLEKKSTTVS
ncbi:MAG TPA: COX15/CtaA family protein [Nitrososphaeraceae archaeon]|nr:COX15/CtaA family protein [Nitrososphaeraceae archaeon]